MSRGIDGGHVRLNFCGVAHFQYESCVRVEMTRALSAFECGSGDEPPPISEGVLCVELFYEGPAFARRANELSVEGIRALLFGLKDILLTFDRCQRQIWVHFCKSFHCKYGCISRKIRQ